MWARLDENLIDHRKVWTAGKTIGRNGPAIALGFYAVGLLWANKHLSDGHLPREVVRAFQHVGDPLKVADALVQSGLWEQNGDGFLIHDYADFGNPIASKVKEYRKRERERKQRGRERLKAHKARPVRPDSTRTPRGLRAESARTRRARDVESKE